MIGRREALDAFEQGLDAALGGEFQFIALSGDPGAGKTRLLGELAARAIQRGVATHWGRAAEFEQQVPFSALVDALDDHLEAQRAEIAGRFGAEPARLLAKVFPALAGDDAGSESGADLRYRLYRAIRQLLDELAAPAGLALILDDVHWADETSIELLDHLVRHPPRGRVLVAVAYRPAQAPPRLEALSAAHIVAVDPLNQAEVDEFLGPGVSRARSRTLFEASGGNPFYLEALVRMGERELAELPPTVRAALQVELEDLSTTAMRVAQGAAVAADEFEPGLASVSAQVSADETLKGLNELVSRDIVRPGSVGRFRFRHPLVRRAAYESSAAGWRHAAHARIAAQLGSLGAPATVQAIHVQRSASAGDQRAAATLIHAAQAVSAQAPATAAHWLDAALRLLPDDPTPRRLELLMELALVQGVSGQLTQGRETARQLLRLLPADDYTRRARAVQLCAVMERQLDRPLEARALVLDELRRYPDPQAPAAVRLRVRLVADYLMRVDVRAAQAVLDLMPESAPEWEPGLAVAVAAMRPMPAYAAGHIDQAAAYVEAADLIFTAATDDHLAECLDSVPWLCWAELMMGRYHDALRHADRSLAVARATGQSYILTYLLTARARTLTMLGRLEEAAAAAEEAAEGARLLGSGEVLVFALTQQCLIATWSGDHEPALRLGEQAIQTGVGAGEWWGAMARYAHAVALINAGRTDEGAVAILDACGASSAPMLDPGTLVAASEELARIEVARGRPEDAAKWAEVAHELAPPGLDTDAGIVRLAQAHAVRPHDAVAAAQLAGEAASLLMAVQRPIDAGRALLTAGFAYGDAGKGDLARKALRDAAQIFDTCGARALHAQVVREQRRLGVRVPSAGGRAGTKGPFGLSRRELEIATLVAEGHTNQQIAGKLVLSVRTVETHLTRVFAKLHVTSRVGVVKALNREP